MIWALGVILLLIIWRYKPDWLYYLPLIGVAVLASRIGLNPILNVVMAISAVMPLWRMWRVKQANKVIDVTDYEDKTNDKK